MGYKSFGKEFLKDLSDLYEESELKSIWRLVEFYDFLSFSETEAVNRSEEYANLLTRLRSHEPIQQIIGWTYFYDFDLKVTKDTLIPRRETEELAYMIVQNHASEEINVLDIGTGSGCIALALAKHLPTSKVFAIDVSEKVLAVAKENAELLSLNIFFNEKDVLRDHLEDDMYDIIVSNPPYIPNAEKTLMHQNVLNFEPDIALFVSDDDPLIFYRVIAEKALLSLREGGFLYFECNEFNAEDLQKLLVNLNYFDVQIHLDMQGKMRMISCQKAGY